MPAHKLPDKEFGWTPDLAYVVGLITTDGSLSKDGRHIIVTSTDQELLQIVKKALKLTVTIGKNPPNKLSKKQAWKIQFGNVQFYRWLMRLGLAPDKTHKLRSIKIPQEFFRDFARGHIDGDGSIFSYIDAYNKPKNPKYVYTRLITYFQALRKEHIVWIRGNLNNLIGIKGCLMDRSNIGAWILKFSKKESITLLNWIYYSPTVPCLKRKYLKAKPFLS